MLRVILFLLCGFSVAWAQNPATAVFPPDVATDADLLVANNSAVIDLAADLAIDGMSVAVSDASRFTPPLILTIEAEKIKVCSKLANTLTVCPGGRAFAGTTAAAHANGKTAVAYVEASGWNQTNAEVKAIETALGANLENVVSPSALAAWPGSPSITTLGTISSGTIPWEKVGSKPSVFAPSAHAASHVQGAADALSGTLNVNIVGSSGNASALGGLGLQTAGAAPEANQVLRSDGSAYTYLGWINTVSGDNGTAAISRVYASNDAFIRYYSLANFAKQSANAVAHDASWAWQDNYVALPLSTVQWGVFTPRAANATIVSVVCWDDTGNGVIQLRRNDGGDMINGNLTCNGTAKADLNGYNSIPVGYYVGMWAVSGTAKSIRVGITYTTAY